MSSREKMFIIIAIGIGIPILILLVGIAFFLNGV